MSAHCRFLPCRNLPVHSFLSVPTQLPYQSSPEPLPDNAPQYIALHGCCQPVRHSMQCRPDGKRHGWLPLRLRQTDFLHWSATSSRFPIRRCCAAHRERFQAAECTDPRLYPDRSRLQVGSCVPDVRLVYRNRLPLFQDKPLLLAAGTYNRMLHSQDLYGNPEKPCGPCSFQGKPEYQ